MSKEYECECGMTFANGVTLKRHERIIHAGGAPSFCSNCFHPSYYINSLKIHIYNKCEGANIIHVDPLLRQQIRPNARELWWDQYSPHSNTSPFESVSQTPIWCGKVNLTPSAISKKRWVEASGSATGAVILRKTENVRHQFMPNHWPKILQLYMLPSGKLPKNALTSAPLFRVMWTDPPIMSAVSMKLKQGYFGCFPIPLRVSRESDHKYLVMFHDKCLSKEKSEWVGCIVEDEGHCRVVRSLLQICDDSQTKESGPPSRPNFKPAKYEEVQGMVQIGNHFECPRPACNYKSWRPFVIQHYNVDHLGLRWTCQFCHVS